MKCPYCGAQDTKVIDSRPADDNSAIRRRRQCEQCGKRFTTYEKLETLPLMIIKKDNSREAYDRSKIEKGDPAFLSQTADLFGADPEHDRRDRNGNFQPGGKGDSGFGCGRAGHCGS